MSAAHKYLPSHQPTRLGETLATIAANDNIHLHLVTNNDDNPFVSVPFSTGSSATGPRTLSYDSRGNVTALGGLFFTYDMSDQPTAISGNGPNGMVNGTYTYDGNLKRVRSVIDGKTIYNVYDAGGTLIHIHKLAEGLTPEEKTDMIGKVARITTSNGVDKITYLHNDHLGSANTGTDALGNVLWREQYTPFGSTLTSPLANQDQAGFTGHIKDSATGLNYMQARYYDPLIGRFLSRDPIRFSPSRPEMFGSYTYVNNDPVNAIDPSGEVIEEIIEFVGDVLSGNIGGTELSDAATANYNSAISNANSGEQTLSQGMNINMDVDSGASQDLGRMGAATAFDLKEEAAITGGATVLGVASGAALLEATALGVGALGTSVEAGSGLLSAIDLAPLASESLAPVTMTLEGVFTAGTIEAGAVNTGIYQIGIRTVVVGGGRKVGPLLIPPVVGALSYKAITGKTRPSE